MTTKETQLLEEKIKNKLIAAEENRIEKLNSITERLKEHESHVEEVRKATTNNKEEMEEKIIQKLQNAFDSKERDLHIQNATFIEALEDKHKSIIDEFKDNHASAENSWKDNIDALKAEIESWTLKFNNADSIAQKLGKDLDTQIDENRYIFSQ